MLRKVFLSTCNILVLLSGLSFLSSAISSIIMCATPDSTYLRSYLPTAILYSLLAIAVLSLGIIAITKVVKVFKNDDSSRVSSILLVIAISLIMTSECYTAYSIIANASSYINMSKQNPNDPFYLRVLISNIASFVLSSIHTEIILALAVLSFFNFKKKDEPRPIQ